ncbi:hypothetical protein QWI29_22275 [Mycolicibacterium neoaurum]|uniref:hypothetical protein n=1 Tax=Mycolicibacterium neoaurum TaxID=1795 RepID=UPI00267341CE|nr:hypothetical protein [Mycolicibacterium neoaurum]MDO3402777.1 hypothetical protein [Mycolicibacterium neoaurum]
MTIEESKTGGGPRLTTQLKRRIVFSVCVFAAIALVITWLRGGVVVGSMDIRMDPMFRIPQPPRDIEWWPLGTYISIGVVAVADVVLIGMGIRDYLRTKSWMPLMVGLSALAYVIPEVFVDVLGGVYMTADQHLVIFEILGREMGVFILLSWLSYGWVPYAFYKLLLSNPKTKALWIGLLGAAIANVVNEEWLLLFRAYHYYGNQPLVLLNTLPWWWIPCNSVGAILCASIAYRYRHLLRGWRTLAMFVISPMCVMGVYGFIAMPSFIAVNGDYPWLPTQLAGLATVGLGIAVFMAILHLVLQRHPLDLDHIPTSGAHDVVGNPESGVTKK